MFSMQIDINQIVATNIFAFYQNPKITLFFIWTLEFEFCRVTYNVIDIQRGGKMK